MRGENIVRIIALIGLCGLVYYFSFDQGRRAAEPAIRGMESRVAAKDRIIESLAVEVRRLKEELEAARQSAGEAGREGGAEAEQALASDRFTLRLQASRILFDQRVVVSCLAIDREAGTATIQINLVREETLLAEPIKLGQGLKFVLDDQSYALILDQIQPNFVTAQLIRM